jgi:hypothetical protein
MRIYRYEHNRAACENTTYNSDGPSLTGHGTYTSCPNKDWDNIPAFGFAGLGPARIMEHERCAVTAEQFSSWQGASFSPTKKYRDWDIVSYEVDDTKEGIDWRYDNGQIVFNPEFASYVGTVTVAEIRKARLSKVRG